MFTNPSAFKQPVKLPSTDITEVNLFGYIYYLIQVWASWRRNNIHNYAISANDGAWETEFTSFTAWEDGKDNGNDFVQISAMFGTEDEFFVRMA